MGLITRSTLLHLRIPFSFYLMPVFLFALSQSHTIIASTTFLSFIILHMLVFPASNGYNSFQDRDTSSIGGLKNPPEVSKNLFYVTAIMDITAIALSFIISYSYAIFIFLYVVVSRAYSYRRIRIKKNPVLSFITIFIFQGAYVFMVSTLAISGVTFKEFFISGNIICMAVSSLFMGGIYPLTQIYQHKSDLKDGVTSLSYKLGFNGTFVFSSVMFLFATILLIYYLGIQKHFFSIGLFAFLMIPAAIQFLRWFRKVYANPAFASYQYSMRLNFLMSLSMNLYFIILLINNQLSLFE
jgi:1,4-dihydroxy-2-naphthoate octaprenyltransferase